MKIIHITPGTGSFICGTCIRDNALVAALRKLGHDAVMLPMYLPLITDEPNTSKNSPLFFGGINVYLQQKIPLFKNTPRWIDSLFDSNGLLKWSARHMGMTRASDLGDITVSVLEGEEGGQLKELKKLVSWLKSTDTPNIVCLSNALLVGLARQIKDELHTPVVCTLQGEDTFLDSLPLPQRQQAWKTLALRAKDIDLFIAVSHYHGNLMKERLDIPSTRIRMVYNGITLDGFRPADTRPDPPVLGYFARLCPAKGLDKLVDAFVILKSRHRVEGLKLRVAGSMARTDKLFVDKLKHQLNQKGLSGDVEFFPNVSRNKKIEFLRSISVFSVPATYGESFGLYVLESLAAGVPVVQPDHASFPELINSTGGGVLYRPNDTESLADSIEELLLNEPKRRTLGNEGRKKVFQQFDINYTATEVARICQNLS